MPGWDYGQNKPPEMRMMVADCDLIQKLRGHRVDAKLRTKPCQLSIRSPRPLVFGSLCGWKASPVAMPLAFPFIA
jgi:hypothetical protein